MSRTAGEVNGGAGLSGTLDRLRAAVGSATGPGGGDPTGGPAAARSNGTRSDWDSGGGARVIPRLLAWLALPLAIVGVAAVVVSATTVQSGYVGVVLTFGRADPRVLPPGFHLVACYS